MQTGMIRARVVVGMVLVAMGAAIAIPLGRYAEQDDAPGGVVIAFGIFIGTALLAAWIVRRAEP